MKQRRPVESSCMQHLCHECSETFVHNHMNYSAPCFFPAIEVQFPSDAERRINKRVTSPRVSQSSCFTILFLDRGWPTRKKRIDVTARVKRPYSCSVPSRVLRDGGVCQRPVEAGTLTSSRKIIGPSGFFKIYDSTSILRNVIASWSIPALRSCPLNLSFLTRS